MRKAWYRAPSADEPDAVDGGCRGRERSAGGSPARARHRSGGGRPLRSQCPALGAKGGFPRPDIRPRPACRPLRTARPVERRCKHGREAGPHRPASVRILLVSDLVDPVPVALYSPAAPTLRGLRDAGDSRSVAAPSRKRGTSRAQQAPASVQRALAQRGRT